MNTATVIAIVLAGLALVGGAAAVIFSLTLYAKVTRMAEPHRRFLEALGQMEFPDDLAEFLALLGTVHRRVEENERRVEALTQALRGAVARVGLVRFDAFENMGGMMSFALALTDDRGNGVIMTGIHSRNSFDTYCRRVLAGAPELEVSAEEQQALSEALQGWRP